MLSFETERRLKNYLVAVAEGEGVLERLRQRLCEIRDFAPCMAFQRLDRCANDYLTSIQLLNFLRDNCVYSVSENECFRLLRFFDSDEDGRLSYSDFNQLLLPCDDNCLRQITLDRHACRVARYENLPLDIERGISGVIEREVELLRRLDTLKRELEIRYDFSPYAAFKTIDKCCEGAITTLNLTQFLRGQGYYATEREVVAIIRRMDTSCAASVSYSDFSDFLRGHGSSDFSASHSQGSSGRPKSADRTAASPKKLSDSLTKARASSANRTSPKKKGAKKACCSDCEEKGTSCCDTPARLCPPPFYCRPSALCCEYPCWPYSYCRPAYPYPCRPCSPPLCKPYCPLLSHSQEYDLVKGLYDIIKEERDLESAKLNLARRLDFNLYDAFRIFDSCNRGYITLADLRDGLAAIGVYPSTADMELYIKRYDRFGERRLRFSEFSDSFTPTTDAYASSSLARRRTNPHVPSRFSARDDCFEAGTRVELRAAWNTHFKVESMCEGIRQRHRLLPCFDLYSAFLTCDLYHDGVISKDELRRLIDSRGFYVTETDAKHLVDKMDRDRDGVVSYSEFREELEPKRGY